MLAAPTANELLRAKPIKSVHVFAFTANKKILLAESDGRFSHEEWDEACSVAENICCGDLESDDDDDNEEGGVRLDDGMEIDSAAQGRAQGESLEKWLRSVVQRKVEHEQRWKSAT